MKTIKTLIENPQNTRLDCTIENKKLKKLCQEIKNKLKRI